MRKSQFSKEQIICIRKRGDAGRTVVYSASRNGLFVSLGDGVPHLVIDVLLAPMPMGRHTKPVSEPNSHSLIQTAHIIHLQVVRVMT